MHELCHGPDKALTQEYCILDTLSLKLRRSSIVQVRHCNNSLKHTESAYYEELAGGFCTLVKGCNAEPQVPHHSCRPPLKSQCCLQTPFMALQSPFTQGRGIT